MYRLPVLRRRLLGNRLLGTFLSGWALLETQFTYFKRLFGLGGPSNSTLDRE